MYGDGLRSFAAALNASITILIQLAEVVEHLALLLRKIAEVGARREPLGEARDELLMRRIVMCLQVPELVERLVAVIELTHERVVVVMRELVVPHVPLLAKCAAADAALIWPLARVAPNMCAQVAALAERLMAPFKRACVRPLAAVAAHMSMKVRALLETLAAARDEAPERDLVRTDLLLFDRLLAGLDLEHHLVDGCERPDVVLRRRHRRRRLNAPQLRQIGLRYQIWRRR